MVNLVKFIAASGAASRRRAEELIRNGEVCVNGALCTDPAHRVAPDEVVSLNGKPLAAAVKLWYILLNKPRSFVCSNQDRHAENLAVDLLKSVVKELQSLTRAEA